MIVTLEVERCRSKGIISRLNSVFTPYRIGARIKKQHRITVLQLSYKAMRGRVRFEKLKPYLSGCGGVVLCDEDTDLSGSGLKRFDGEDFRLRMTESLLQRILSDESLKGNEPKTAFYDPKAEHPETAEVLAEVIPGLTAVTDQPKYYEIFADGLMEEKGISLTVSNSPEALSDKQLVVSACAIDRPLPISSQCLVFSPAKPLVSMKSTVLWDHSVEVPYKYRRLKPDGIDGVYFLSALYSLAGAKELESLVPQCSTDGHDIFSPERILHRLCAIRKTA